MVMVSPGSCLHKGFKNMYPCAPPSLLHVRCQTFLLAQLRGHRQPVYLHQASKTFDILRTDVTLGSYPPGTALVRSRQTVLLWHVSERVLWHL